MARAEMITPTRFNDDDEEATRVERRQSEKETKGEL